MPKKAKTSKQKKSKTIPQKAGAKATHTDKKGNKFVTNVVAAGSGTGGPGSRGGPGSYKERRPANSRDRMRSGGMPAEDIGGIMRDKEQGSALRRRLGGGSLASAFPSNRGFTGSEDVVRKEDDRVFAEAVLRESKRQQEKEKENIARNQRRDEAIEEARRQQEAIAQQPQEVVGRIISPGGIISPRGKRFPEPKERRQRQPQPSPLSLGRPATAPQLQREQARTQNNPEQAIRQVGGQVQVDTDRLIPWRGGTRSIRSRTSDEGAKFKIRESREDQIRRIVTTPQPLKPPPPISADEKIAGIITRSNAPPPPTQDYRAKTLRMRQLQRAREEGKTRADFDKFVEERNLAKTKEQLAIGDELTRQIDVLFDRDPSPSESDFESDFSGDTSEDMPTIPEDKEAERKERRQARREALFPDPLREFRVEPQPPQPPPPAPSPARAGLPIPIQPQRAQGDLTQFLVNQPRTLRDIDPRYRLSVSEELGFSNPPMIYNPQGDAPKTPLDRGGVPALLPRRPEEERYEASRLDYIAKVQAEAEKLKKRPDNLKAYRDERKEDPDFKPFDTPSSEEIVNTPRRRRRKPKDKGQGPPPSSPKPKEERPLRPAQFESGAEAYETPSDLSSNWISTDEGGGSGADAMFRRSRRQAKIKDKQEKLQRRKEFLEESQTDAEGEPAREPAPVGEPATKGEFIEARKELKKQLNQQAIQESIQAQAGGGAGRARRGQAKERLSEELRAEAQSLEEEIKNIKRQLSAKGIKRGDISKAATKKSQPGIVQNLKELGLLDEADTEALLEQLFIAMRRQQQIRNIKKS